MTSTVAAAALALSGSLPVSILVKATVGLAVACVALRLARRCRAAIRHAVLSAAFAVLAALPIIAIVAPASIAVAVPIDRGKDVDARDGSSAIASDPLLAMASGAAVDGRISSPGAHGS